MNVRDPRTRSFGFIWGVILAVCMIAALTVATFPILSADPIVPIAFACAMALGPFAALLVNGMGSDALLVGVTIAAIALIPAHALRPSKWTFFLTCCGLELWIATGWAILLMSA